MCQDKEEVLRATKILTLWEPNWGSAWVLRRRWLNAFALRLGARAGGGEGGEGRDSSIVGMADTSSAETDSSIGMQSGSFIEAADERWRRGKIKEAVEGELAWVETLVRSPLCGKHAKSSWVWAHRRWVLTEFYGEVADGYTGDRGGGAGAFVKRELEIVMIAGERHARNYYAWEYAREVVRMAGARLGHSGWEEVVWMVHHWCLMHPRDISGWAFLVFLLDQSMNTDSLRRDIFGKTRDFVEKFGWKGESVEWFLKSASHFHINSHD